MVALTESRPFSRQLSGAFLSAFSHQPKKSWFIPEWTFWTWKFYKCFLKIGGNFSFFKECWISWVFWFYFMFQDVSSKKKFFKIFLTDRKISSPIHLVYWWWNFSISLKNFEKKFFAWNVLKHKVKPKNSRNSTFFKN